MPARFARLLQVLAPGDESYYTEGRGETEEKIKKLNDPTA